MSTTHSPDTKSHAEAVEKLGGLIKEVKFAMLTTRKSDGTLHSRPMATQKEEFDGTLWFFTGLNSEKIAELGRDSKVNLSYADPGDSKYISVSGEAEVSRDRAKMKELWNDILKAWFPEGLNDPNLALLKVNVDQAEYWANPSGKMVQLFGFLKAITTGQPARPGGHGEVEIGKSAGAGRSSDGESHI